MEVIFSTHNPSKAEQVRALFKGSRIRVRTLDEAGIYGEAVEDGVTLAENAEKKARYAQERSLNVWTMADDTGLFIEALHGEPGIRAARWAGNVSTEETMRYCLQCLEGQTNRKAIFCTVVVVISPENRKSVFAGEVSGTLLTAPRCALVPKMPYSSLFVPDGQPLVWGEMTTEYENSISHRGKAFRQARRFLESL